MGCKDSLRALSGTLLKAVQALRGVGHLGVMETYERYSVVWVEDRLMTWRGGKGGM